MRIGRFIYVVGGLSERLQTMSTVERYDIRRDRWESMPPIPVALNHAAAVAYKGRLYVHGGFPGTAELFSFTSASWLYRFNPRQNRWVQLPPAPTPRAAEAAAVIGDRMYVAGGANETGSLNSLEVYDFRRKRWMPGPSFDGPARNHAVGVASGGFFYVLGGRSGGTIADPFPAQLYADVDRYNPRRRRWLRMPPMHDARSGFAAASLLDGRIVAFGGEEWPNNVPEASVIGTVEVFEPGLRRWAGLTGMRTPRHSLGGAALGNSVYAINGFTRAGGSSPPSTVLEALEVGAASDRDAAKAERD